MAYKGVTRSSTIDALISDGYSQIEELANECQEASDNFPNSSHPKAEAFGEVASQLGNVSMPDVPEHALFDEEVQWTEMVNRDKRKGQSRSTRLDNARSELDAAATAIRDHIDGTLTDLRDGLEAKEPASDEESNARDAALKDVEELIDTLTELADQLESDSAEVDGVEFPGLYG